MKKEEEREREIIIMRTKQETNLMGIPIPLNYLNGSFFGEAFGVIAAALHASTADSVDAVVVIVVAADAVVLCALDVEPFFGL